MSIVGRTYYERGRPVVILVQWRTGGGPSGPRNVRIRREDGSELIRPFRGLRTEASRVQPDEDDEEDTREGAERHREDLPPG